MAEQLVIEGAVAGIQATATGDNVLVATQGTTRSIVVNSFSIVANTATTNLIVCFQFAGTTTSFFTNHLITKGQRADLFLGNGKTGWKIGKNQGLDFNMNTTSSVAVDVVYSVLDDLQ